MDYYKTSPDYVKLKLGEENVERKKKVDIMKIALGLFLIGGMIFCGVTAYQYIHSKQMILKNTARVQIPERLENRLDVFEKQENKVDSDDSWIYLPYRLVIVHVYTPLFTDESQYVEHTIEQSTDETAMATTSQNWFDLRDKDFNGIVENFFNSFFQN